MNEIKGKDLIKLGFDKTISIPIMPSESEFHYYTFSKGNTCIFITCANDEKVNDGYTVEFYDTDIQFKNLRDFKKLFKLIEKAINEQ